MGSMDVSCRALSFSDDLVNDDSSYNFAGGLFGLENHSQNKSPQNSPLESVAGLHQDDDEYDEFFKELLAPAKIQPLDHVNNGGTLDPISTNEDRKIDSMATSDVCSRNSASQDLVFIDTEDECDNAVQQSFDLDFNFTDFSDQFGLSQTDSTSLPNLHQHISTEMKPSKRQLKYTPHKRCMKQKRFRPAPALYKKVLKRCLMTDYNMVLFQCCENNCKFRWQMAEHDS